MAFPANPNPGDKFVNKYGTHYEFKSPPGAWIIISSETEGDMRKEIYDPNEVEADAFSMENMVETADAKILSNTERTAISDNSLARHTHTNKTTIDKIGEDTGEPTWNGDPWPAGSGKGYAHTQTTASGSWGITHNLDTTNIIVAVYNNDNEEVKPNEITIDSANAITISFVPDLAGRAVIVGF